MHFFGRRRSVVRHHVDAHGATREQRQQAQAALVADRQPDVIEPGGRRDRAAPACARRLATLVADVERLGRAAQHFGQRRRQRRTRLLSRRGARGLGRPRLRGHGQREHAQAVRRRWGVDAAGDRCGHGAAHSAAASRQAGPDLAEAALPAITGPRAAGAASRPRPVPPSRGATAPLIATAKPAGRASACAAECSRPSSPASAAPAARRRPPARHTARCSAGPA